MITFQLFRALQKKILLCYNNDNDNWGNKDVSSKVKTASNESLSLDLKTKKDSTLLKPTAHCSTFASPHEPTLKPKACKRAAISSPRSHCDKVVRFSYCYKFFIVNLNAKYKTNKINDYDTKWFRN